MGFITKNDGFTCEACSITVPPAQATCRNHCTACLTSKHVDEQLPGDRGSSCCGLMRVTGVEGVDIDKLDLIHTCNRCGKLQRNKVASDDDRDAILTALRQTR